MYPTKARKGTRRGILAKIKSANAEALRSDRPRCPWTVTIGDVDLPAYISDGKLCVQAPLPDLFEAFAESLPDFVRDMEIRVSNTRGTSLSLDRDGRPIYRSWLAVTSLVPDGAER